MYYEKGLLFLRLYFKEAIGDPNIYTVTIINDKTKLSTLISVKSEMTLNYLISKHIRTEFPTKYIVEVGNRTITNLDSNLWDNYITTDAVYYIIFILKCRN